MSSNWLWAYLKGSELAPVLTTMLRAHKRPVAFVVGSALSAPDHDVPDSRGVPDVNGMIERIARVFDGDAFASEGLKNRLLANPTERYPTAMRFLSDWLDPDAVQAVVRDAVLEARSKPEPDREWTDLELRRIDKDDVDGWFLPPGVSGLAELLVEQPDKYPGPVLTTNFDPLLSVAIRRAGGQVFRTVLTNDGQLPGRGGDSPIPLHVVHLHGYWLGPTLHTQAQLAAPRPMLAQSLQRILRERTVVVIGYGGWDDVFMNTLRAMLFDDKIQIVWCFREDRVDTLIERYRDFFEKMLDLIQRNQFRIYRGVDCRTVFGDLLNRGPAVSARPAPGPLSGTHEHGAVPALPPVPAGPKQEDQTNVSARHDADRDSSGIPPDLASLRAEQVNNLRDTVTAFDLFLAAASRTAAGPAEAVADPISDTTLLLLSEGLQQRLDHLKVIRADNWPAVEWATPVGTMVVQAQRHLKRYQHYAQGLDQDDDYDAGASAADCPQLKDLRTAIEVLRKHIAGHYPSLCPAPQPGNRK